MAEQLVVEVGMESFRPGRTRVEVSVTGDVRIRNRHSGVARQAETTVAPAVAARLLQQARAVRLDAQRSFRMPVLDEVCYAIAPAEDGTPVVTARFWPGELRRGPASARPHHGAPGHCGHVHEWPYPFVDAQALDSRRGRAGVRPAAGGDSAPS